MSRERLNPKYGESPEALEQNINQLLGIKNDPGMDLLMTIVGNSLKITGIGYTYMCMWALIDANRFKTLWLNGVIYSSNNWNTTFGVFVTLMFLPPYEVIRLILDENIFDQQQFLFRLYGTAILVEDLELLDWIFDNYNLCRPGSKHIYRTWSSGQHYISDLMSNSFAEVLDEHYKLNGKYEASKVYLNNLHLIVEYGKSMYSQRDIRNTLYKMFFERIKKYDIDPKTLSLEYQYVLYMFDQIDYCDNDYIRYLKTKSIDELLQRPLTMDRLFEYLIPDMTEESLRLIDQHPWDHKEPYIATVLFKTNLLFKYVPDFKISNLKYSNIKRMDYIEKYVKLEVGEGVINKIRNVERDKSYYLNDLLTKYDPSFDGLYDNNFTIFISGGYCESNYHRDYFYHIHYKVE